MATDPDRGDDFTATDDDAVVDEPKTEKVDDKKVDDKKSALKAEGEDKVEEKVQTEEKVEDNKPKKDERVPAARHKEILDKERARREAVETELAKYKQGGAIANVNAEITEAEESLVALEKTYAKQLVDGEGDKAAETMTKIRRTERAINTKTSQVREQAAEARAVERARYDTTVDRLESLYPALNLDHEDFDKDKTAEVLEMKEAFEAKGYTPSAALQRAVKYVMPPTTAAQATALKVEARVDVAAVEKQRKAAAVEKVTDALAKTPASSSKVGKDSDSAGGGAVTAKDAMKMSYKDFSALDEDSLAKMRGDVI